MLAVIKKIGLKRWTRIKLDRLLVKCGARPSQNYALNPLRDYPRNLPCWCGSYLKAKKCCLPKQGRLCLASDAKLLADFMKDVKRAMKEG